jgi:hypothetical protein
MSQTTDQSLNRIHELIEAERLSDARDMLESILATTEEDADVWWLYAHAVEDVGSARVALRNVLRLDPNYPGAAQLMEQVQTNLQSSDFGDSEFDDLDSALDFDDLDDLPRRQAREPNLDLDLDLDFDEDDYIATEEPPDRPRRRSPLLRILLLIALLAVLVVVSAYVLMNVLGSRDADVTIEPTSAAQVVDDFTPEPQASPEPVEVDDNDIVDAQFFSIVMDALGDFELYSATAEVTQSELGTTVLAAVCTQPGESLRSTLDGVMAVLTDQAQVIANETDAVGVRLLDCEDAATLNVIAVSLQDISDYLEGSLTDAEFRGRWRAVAVD